MPTKLPVWDLPTRIFHWGLAVSVFLSMFIVYGRAYLTLHVISGTVAFALIVGRIVWGFIGTRYVRFSAFVKGIDEAKKEFAVIKDDVNSHSVGHPAVAGWVMLFLMFCAFGVGISGIWLWQFSDEITKEGILYWHEIFANTLLAIAFVHIQGVILHIILHRDGIVKGMIDGKRPALEQESIGELTVVQKIIAALWFFGSAAAALLALRFI